MASDITVCHRPGCPVSWRPVICLEEKGLSGYSSKHFSAEELSAKPEDLLKINPRGQVPAFMHGDVIVNESIGICLYIENTFKNQGTKLLPDDPAKQALVFQRMMESSNINFLGAAVVAYVRKKPEDRDEEVLAEKGKALVKELHIWENYLAQNVEGPFITGKDFTLADVALFPILALGVHLKQPPNTDQFPRLQKYYELVKERPSVKASWPARFKSTSDSDGTMKDV